MKNFAKNFIHPLALSTALAVSCEPFQQKPEPRNPVVVDIGDQSSDFVRVIPENPVSVNEAPLKTEEQYREEQIRHILENITSETREFIESEIEQIKFIYPVRYMKCLKNSNVQEAQKFTASEERRVEREAPEQFYFCMQIGQLYIERMQCSQKVYEKDRIIQMAQKYTRQLLKECIENKR